MQHVLSAGPGMSPLVCSRVACGLDGRLCDPRGRSDRLKLTDLQAGAPRGMGPRPLDPTPACESGILDAGYVGSQSNLHWGL